MQSRKEDLRALDVLKPSYGMLPPQQPQLASLARNLANHRWAEEALVESEARYRIVAQTAVDAIVTIDEDGEVLFVNNSVERIFGFSAAEILGRSLKLLVPSYRPEDDPTACQQREVSGRHKDG